MLGDKPHEISSIKDIPHVRNQSISIYFITLHNTFISLYHHLISPHHYLILIPHLHIQPNNLTTSHHTLNHTLWLNLTHNPHTTPSLTYHSLNTSYLHSIHPCTHLHFMVIIKPSLTQTLTPYGPTHTFTYTHNYTSTHSTHLNHSLPSYTTSHTH